MNALFIPRELQLRVSDSVLMIMPVSSESLDTPGRDTADHSLILRNHLYNMHSLPALVSFFLLPSSASALQFNKYIHCPNHHAPLYPSFL